MGIKLDWQVESEQTQVHATEAPEARRRRQLARRRFLLLVIGLASILGLVVAAIVWRLDRAEGQYRQDLLDTVAIEVTALRIGDYESFREIQRSTSPDFSIEQGREFEEYQQLKQTHRVELTGEVLDVTIDDRRGRVVVQENIDGVPYKVVWFYWYYDADDNGPGGWRRVPDDLRYFWGDEQTITTENVQITYRDFDADLVDALAPRLQEWWAQGCVILGCATPPPNLHVDIVAERPVAVEWATTNPWLLRVTSPQVERVRADVPIAPNLAESLVRQIAARLVRYAAGEVSPVTYSDSTWLYDELARWLALTLISDGGATASDPGFLGTLIAQYGPGAPHTVLRALYPNATLDSVLAAVTGVPMPLLSVEQLNALNWHDFFQWRLELEMRLLGQSDSSGAFLSLYDQDDLAAANEANLRLENPAYAARTVPRVQAVIVTRDANSQTFAYVDVTWADSGGPVPETIIWRLTGGTWKRAT